MNQREACLLDAQGRLVRRIIVRHGQLYIKIPDCVPCAYFEEVEQIKPFRMREFKLTDERLNGTVLIYRETN